MYVHIQRYLLRPEALVNRTRQYLAEFSEMSHTPIVFGPQEKSNWIKPATGCVKVNVDASFTYGSGMVKVKAGMVIRDSSGQVRCSGVSRFDSVLSPLHAELNAILDGLILAKSQGYAVIEIESDSLYGITEFLNPQSECLCLPMIKDIRKMAESFVSCVFKFASRDCNRLAHDLSHWDIGEASFKAWINDLPSRVRNLDN